MLRLLLMISSVAAPLLRATVTACAPRILGIRSAHAAAGSSLASVGPAVPTPPSPACPGEASAPDVRTKVPGPRTLELKSQMHSVQVRALPARPPQGAGHLATGFPCRRASPQLLGVRYRPRLPL